MSILSSISDYYLKRRLNKQIKIATMAIYSGLLDVDKILTKILTNDDYISQLRAYVVIRVVADTKVQKLVPTLDEVFKEVRSLGLFLKDESMAIKMIELHKAKAKVSLCKAEAEFEIEKLVPEYSFDWAVYQAEKVKQGPLTYKKRERLRGLTEQLDEINGKIEQSNK